MTNLTKTAQKSKTNSKGGKPEKPREDFPLFAHASGRWAKKIRGKLKYFGKWDDPDAALERYLREKAYHFAGMPVPAADDEADTLWDLVERFLEVKESARDAGELTHRSWTDYYKTAERMIKFVGKHRRLDCLKPADFEKLRAKLSEKMGPVTLANELTRCRVILRYAYVAQMVDRPLPYDEALKRPKKKVLRKARRKNGSKAFEAEDVRRIVEAASGPMKAMVLLAINTGCGNSDLGQLTLDDLDSEKGWLDYPRPKTQVDRRAKLWPETIEAIKQAIASRPRPQDPNDANLVFLTQRGEPWYKDTTANPLSREFAKLLADIDDKAAKKQRKNPPAKLCQRGRSFYGLRHTYRTAADETLDAAAIDLTMGHSDNTMGGNYRARIDDRRLEDVADHVHRSLFGEESVESK